MSGVVISDIGMEYERLAGSRLTDKEGTLFCWLSRVLPSEAVMDRAQELINGRPDWDSILSQALRHGTASIIYRNLQRLRNVRPEILQKFGDIYYRTVRSNVLLAGETERVVRELTDDGIEVIVLKGPVTMEMILGNIALYASDDIDILIKVDDIDRARSRLGRRGYALNDKGFDRYRSFFVRELYHISLSNGDYSIEPHWNLFFRYFTTPPEFWWNESVLISSEGRSYRMLSPEKNILYNSFRIYSKAFAQIRFLVMVAELIRCCGNEIGWGKLFLYARTYRFENALRVVLRLCHELLGAEVPESFTALKSLRSRMIYPVVRKMAQQGNKAHPLNKMLLSFLRDDLSGVIRTMARRMFPSMGEIISRYRLPEYSFRAIGYYLLNPLLLLMNRHNKR